MDERLHLAEQFLQEAVYLSRARQAAGVGLVQGPGDNPGCGLGVRAEIVMELSPRARELLALLWPAPGPDPRALQATMSAWIEQQDQLDRKRNHFLRDFRRRHGMDRRGYGAEIEREFAAGLEQLDQEANAGLRAAARALLEAGAPKQAAPTTVVDS